MPKHVPGKYGCSGCGRPFHNQNGATRHQRRCSTFQQGLSQALLHARNAGDRAKEDRTRTREKEKNGDQQHVQYITETSGSNNRAEVSFNNCYLILSPGSDANRVLF